MYSTNPAYFDAPQTTYGVRKMGPSTGPIQRYRSMGTLSVDGKLIPGRLAGIHYGEDANTTPGVDFKQIGMYSLYVLGGLAAGYYGMKVVKDRM